MGLRFSELKYPGAVFELITVMKLGVVGGSILPHFVDDLEPAVSESAQGASVALVLLAVKLVVSFSPDTAREALVSQEVEGMTEVFVTSPALIAAPQPTAVEEILPFAFAGFSQLMGG